MAKKQKKIEIPFMSSDGLTINHKEIFYDDLGDEMNYPKIQKMKSQKVLKVRDEINKKHSKKKRNNEII